MCIKAHTSSACKMVSPKVDDKHIIQSLFSFCENFSSSYLEHSLIMHSANLFTVLTAVTLVTAAPHQVRTPAQLFGRANPSPVSCGRKLSDIMNQTNISAKIKTASTDQRAWPLQSVQGAFQALVDNGNKPNSDKRKPLHLDVI
jgi:hypothetical protein